MGTTSVGTAWAACLIFSSGVGRGGALFHTTCPSTSDASPTSLPPCGVGDLTESWDLSSSADEAVDWRRTTKQKFNAAENMKLKRNGEKQQELVRQNMGGKKMWLET